MGISTFPVASAGGGGTTTSWYLIANANQFHRIAAEVEPGFYEIQCYAPALTSSPTVKVDFMNNSDTVLATFTTVDNDTGSTANSTYGLVLVPSGVTRLGFTPSDSNVNVGITKLADTRLAPNLAVSTYTSSGSVTLSGSATILLLGGGAAGGGGNSFANPGGGGASGFITTITRNAGTYNFTVGAGGTGVSGLKGGAGGTTTFDGSTALGGDGGQRAFSSYTTGEGGIGGSNGGGGNLSAGTNGTPGSGVALPSWGPTPGAAGNNSAGNGNAGGTGGGTYAGGGVGSWGSGNGSGTAGGGATGRGGGGGGGTGLANTSPGGSGQGGAVYILNPI
jgi:hypothetical protein